MIDFTAVAGLIFGLIIIIAGILIGHVPISTILNPEAILVVFGGTLMAAIAIGMLAWLRHRKWL